jgi:hypothetical protein
MNLIIMNDVPIGLSVDSEYPISSGTGIVVRSDMYLDVHRLVSKLGKSELNGTYFMYKPPGGPASDIFSTSTTPVSCQSPSWNV